MKKMILLAGIITASAILLSGCGSDNPKDISDKFINAYSNKKMLVVQNLSTEHMRKGLEETKKSCKESTVIYLENKAKSFRENADKREQGATPNAFSKKDLANKFKKDIDEIQNFSKIKRDEFEKKYGSIEKTPEIEMNNFLKEADNKKFTLTKNLLKASFEAIDLNTTDEVIGVLAQNVMNGNRAKLGHSPLEEAAIDYLDRLPFEINDLCLRTETPFGKSRKIKVVNEKELTKDTYIVEYEITSGNKPKTVIFKLKKINKKWKVDFYGNKESIK